MGHKNKKSLIMQMNEVLQSKLRAGESKHQHKINGTATDYIFSFSTYKNYKKHATYFLLWAKGKYKCKTLAQARQYADEWIQLRISEGKSPFTLKMEVSALCKLYGDTASDYVPTPQRHRKDIKRSRYPVERDKHWSPEKWATDRIFCECTGLRKSELRCLSPEKLVAGKDCENLGNFEDHEDLWYIIVDKGSKGGKKRLAPIIGTPEEVQLVVDTMKNCTTSRVFPKIPDAADQHHFRSVYAERCYCRYARPVEEIPREDRCYRRKDMRKRPPLDVKALFLCSRALGHQRKSICMAHYLRNI